MYSPIIGQGRSRQQLHGVRGGDRTPGDGEEHIFERGLDTAGGGAPSGFQRRWRAAGQHPATIDDRDFAAETFRLTEVVRGHHDGAAAVAAQRGEQRPHRRGGLRIESRHRLVEDDQRRIVDQRARQCEALPHAAAVTFNEIVGAFHKPDQGQQLRRPFTGDPRGQIVQRGRIQEILPPSQAPVYGAFAAQDNPNPPPDGLGVPDRVVAEHPDAPTGGREERAHDAQQCRLPGTVRPKEAKHRSDLHGETDMVQRQDLIALGRPCGRESPGHIFEDDRVRRLVFDGCGRGVCR